MKQEQYEQLISLLIMSASQNTVILTWLAVLHEKATGQDFQAIRQTQMDELDKAIKELTKVFATKP